MAPSLSSTLLYIPPPPPSAAFSLASLVTPSSSNVKPTQLPNGTPASFGHTTGENGNTAISSVGLTAIPALFNNALPIGQDADAGAFRPGLKKQGLCSFANTQPY